MMIIPNAPDPEIDAMIAELQEAQREAYEWKCYVALFGGDEERAYLQRVMDRLPALFGALPIDLAALNQRMRK